MKEIALIPGLNYAADQAAFDPDMMREAGINGAQLGQALAKVMGPFAHLLREGCGFGVRYANEQASIIGLSSAIADTAPLSGRHATLSVRLEADSGYEAVETHRISPDQWGRISAILSEPAAEDDAGDTEALP